MCQECGTKFKSFVKECHKCGSNHIKSLTSGIGTVHDIMREAPSVTEYYEHDGHHEHEHGHDHHHNHNRHR